MGDIVSSVIFSPGAIRLSTGAGTGSTVWPLFAVQLVALRQECDVNLAEERLNS